MAFFGFSNELSSPMGSLILAATDSLLLSPDWSKIIDICDIITNDSLDTTHQALRILIKRMKESDQNIVYLTLVLVEACMKNCGNKFASAVDKTFMDELSHVARGAKGPKNADEALRLIQEWGRVFEQQRRTLPIFFDTYMALKSKGLKFPPEETVQFNHTSFAEPVRREVAPVVQNNDQFQQTNENEFERLTRDLDVVFDQVRLCREILSVSPGIEQDEALAEVVGFLEACRDRMAELIEAGTHGLLGEELFARSLKANEAIIKTLEAEKNKTPIAVDEDLTPAVSQKLNESAKEEPLLDFGVSGIDLATTTTTTTTTAPIIKAPPATGIKATVIHNDEDDDFGSLTTTQTKKKKEDNVRSPIKPIQPPKKANQVTTPAVVESSLIDTTTTAPMAPTTEKSYASDLLDLSNDTVSPLFAPQPAAATTASTATTASAANEKLKDFDDFLSSFENPK